MTKQQKHRERNADQTSKAILDAAEEVFAQSGYSGARIDVIAERSGYNKSLIFHYFTDKLGLYRAVIYRMRDSMIYDIDDSLKRFLTIEDDQITRDIVVEVLKKAMKHAFGILHNNMGNCRMMAWEAAEGWGAFRQAITNEDPAPFALLKLRSILKVASDKQIIRPDIDVDFIVASIIAFPTAFFNSLPRFSYLIPGRTWDAATIADEIDDFFVNLLINGIFVDPDQ